MNAKIEVSNDGGETVFASFQYHGFTSGRVISRVIRGKIIGVTNESVYRIIQRYNRICVWCPVEPEEQTERVEASAEIKSEILNAYDEWKIKNNVDLDRGSWFAFRAGWLACKNAQQSVQLTGETLPDLQALFTPKVLSGLEADTTPLTSN